MALTCGTESDAETAGHDDAHALRALRHVNEMMIVATVQLQSSMVQHPA